MQNTQSSTPSEFSHLAPESFVPLYRQLGDHFRQAILSSKWLPGSSIAPESELAEEFGVSRVTVRKALALLSEEALIIRRRGKGTFVAPKVIIHELGGIHTLSDVINEQSASVQVELLERALAVVVPKNVQELFGIQEGKPALLLRRRHMVDEAPVVLATIYVRSEFEPVLRGAELLSSSVYALLERQLGLSVAEVEEFIFANQAEGYVAEALQIPEYSPVMVMESVGFDCDHRAIDHTTFHFRPDRYKFTVRIAKQKRSS